MDPDRVGTLREVVYNPQNNSFQFIWIPTESGQEARAKVLKALKVSNLYGSRQSRDHEGEEYAVDFIPWFPIYMDPDRVGTR